ncbi:MAG: response regulator [Myxococcaceae bacterium]
MHILICEDEHYIRRALAEHLASLGYQVSEVENALECLDFITHTLPDLILLNSWESIAKLKEQNTNTPLIILSSFEGEESNRDYDYIEKPYQLSQVSNLILWKFGQPSKKKS